MFSFLFFRWITRLDIKWKTPNLKVTELDEEDFDVDDLKMVQQQTRYMNRTLKSIGIKDKDDRNVVIENIKILVSGEDVPDVWGKESTDSSQSRPSKKTEWN